jgi:hypothetical protein
MNEGSVFLNVDDIMEIHRFSIEHYGGDNGLRDPEKKTGCMSL